MCVCVYYEKITKKLKSLKFTPIQFCPSEYEIKCPLCIIETHVLLIHKYQKSQMRNVKYTHIYIHVRTHTYIHTGRERKREREESIMCHSSKKIGLFEIHI